MIAAEPESDTDRRLFFAVWPSAAVADELDRQLGIVRRRSADWLRWQPSRRLHITLLFLGDCDPRRTRQAQAVGRQVAAGVAAHDLRIDGAGRFGQVAWLGVAGAWLVPVHEGLRRQLRVRPERRTYRPHITVARARPSRSQPPSATSRPTWADTVTALRTITSQTWVPEHLDLVASTLGPAPSYQVVERFPWAGAN